MDPLIKRLLVYTDGLTQSRSGIHSLCEDLIKYSLEGNSHSLKDSPEEVFIYDPENPEKNAFFANFMISILRERCLFGLPGSEQYCTKLFRILIEDFFVRKKKFNFSLEADYTIFTAAAEAVKLNLRFYHQINLHQDTFLGIWRFVLSEVSSQKIDERIEKLLLRFLKGTTLEYLIILLEDGDIKILYLVLEEILSNIYQILVQFCEKKDLKGSTYFLYFLIEMLKNIIEIITSCRTPCLETSVELANMLDEFLLNGVFYLICKMSRKHRGHLLIHLGSLELFKEYIKFCAKYEKNYRVEIGTMIGILLVRKLEDVEIRVKSEAALNTLEKIQIKVVFDFVDFLLSGEKLLNEIYYYNDFTKLRASSIEKILTSSFSIFRIIERKEGEDISFKKYLNRYVSGSILGFLGNNSATGLAAEIKSDEDIAKVLCFLDQIPVFTKLASEKPKRLYEEMKTIYPKEEEENISTKICLFMQENVFLDGKKITEVIGGPDESHKLLRRHFMRLLDFRGLDILSALRRFFWMFHMSGETQVIDRIISDFSEEYVEQNPDTHLGDSTPVYGYAFTILMINTNLHNPQVDQKMTLKDFEKNVRLIIPKGGPSSEELASVYDQVEKNQLQALRSIDMINEDVITVDLWDFIHSIKKHRVDIISQLCPDDVAKSICVKVGSIKSYISSILKDSINIIVQDNILFLVENNIGNVKIVADLFESIVEKLSDQKDGRQNILRLFQTFESNINFEKNHEFVCYEEKLAWLTFSFALFFEKAFPLISEQLPFFLNTVFKISNFFSIVAKDRTLRRSIARFNQFVRAFKFASKSSEKKTSFIDALSGFLTRDSSSEGEELGMMRANSVLAKIEAMVPNESNFFYNIAKSSAALSNDEFFALIRSVMTEIFNYRIQPRNSHLAAFSLDVLTELIIANPKGVSNHWDSLAAFYFTIFTDKFDNCFDLPFDQTDNEEKSLFSKRIEKFKSHLNNYSKRCLSRICISMLNNNDSCGSTFGTTLQCSLELYKGASVEIITELFGWVLELLNSTDHSKLTSCDIWDKIAMMLKSIIRIFECKNFDLKHTEDIWREFLQTVEGVFTFISFINTPLLQKASEIMLDSISFLVSSQCIKYGGGSDYVLEIYSGYVESIESKLSEKEWEAEHKCLFILFVFEHFSQFLLMNPKVDSVLSFKIIDSLLEKFFCFKKHPSEEEIIQITEFIENYSKAGGDSIQGVERLGLAQLFSSIHTQQILEKAPTDLKDWLRYLQFMALNFDQACKTQNTNLAEFVAQDLKETMRELREKQILIYSINQSDAIRDWDQSLNETRIISDEFWNVLIKLK